MTDTNRIDPLPDEFRSEEEAAEFWDKHSLADYEEFLEPVNFEVTIKRRHFEIEVEEEVFTALRKTARQQRRPVKQIASEILKQHLHAL
jgi:stress-induced morphogen